MQPYISKPSYDKHPDRMCLIARLFGVEAKLLSSGARILELGSGTGNDLIPMSLGLPQCEFIGADASEEMTNTANSAVQKLRSGNIRFIRQNIVELSPLQLGKFDYIIVHGVLSWVEQHIREHILKFCADNLTDTGVCYISCNMLPGCEVRRFLGQEFKKTDNPKNPPEERIARLRKFLNEFLQSDDKATKHLPFQLSRLHIEAENILKHSDGYLFYDMLSESEAFFFQDLARTAKSFGLKYLGDSKLKRVGFLDVLDFQGCIETSDEFIACCEQEADLARQEMFRANLFCKNSVHIERKPDLSVIEKCFLSTVLTYNEDNFGETFFFSPGGKRIEIESSEVREILKVLIQNWPRPVSYYELGETVTVGANLYVRSTEGCTPGAALTELFELFKKELLDLYLTDPFQTATARQTDKPAISPYAGLQLKTQNWATNYRHEYVHFTENEIKIAGLLDGSNSVQDIFDKLEKTVPLNEIEDILLFLEESAFI